MTYRRLKWLTFALLVMTGTGATTSHAHLMVADQGTLNFLGEDVYMVLSLPAAAFTDADEDDDGLLSITEFSNHRNDIIKIISENVSLSSKKEKLPLNGLIISPVTPHDAPKDPADQIIAMGRFALDDSKGELSFHVGLFSPNEKDPTLKITARRKKEDKQHVFNLTPDVQSAQLTFR